MLYLVAKATISGIIIMAASEVAKRSPTYGALLVSLPKEGFGTLLIRQVIVNRFHGTLDQVWNASGLTIEIMVPQRSIAPAALPLATAE